MRKISKRKIKYYIMTIINFIFNPKLLLCFGLAWLITNGWAYICVTIGTWLKINWLSAIAGTYLTIMWIPATPEKLLTIIISIFLLKLFFPNDKKTFRKLQNMKNKIINKTKSLREKYRNKHDKN